jgi:tRNA(His) 5'-end guanylyltransferase
VEDKDLETHIVFSPFRLKPLESAVDFEVPATQPFVIRLDGVAFSTFTKGLPRPFDYHLTEAMVSTTVDLLTKFNATMAYTQSDEISLVFPAQMGALVPPDLNQREEDKTKKQAKRGVKRKANEEGGVPEGGGPLSETVASKLAGVNTMETEQTESPNSEEVKPRGKPPKEVQRNHPYNGRVQKLASCTASYASARLNFYLQKKDWTHLDKASQERMVSATAYFDGRVVPCNTNSECSDCIFWRSNFDGFRNAIGQVARAYVSNIPKSTAGQKDAQTKLHGRGSREMLAILWNQANIKVFGEGAVVPERFLFGTWIKKERYELHGCVNPMTGKPVEGPVWRTRARVGSFNWADWTEQERAEFAMGMFSRPFRPIAI